MTQPFRWLAYGRCPPPNSGRGYHRTMRIDLGFGSIQVSVWSRSHFTFLRLGRYQ